ncbi:signal transduction histidine kinase [Virgibacillus campisalis]|uniref:Signal transduction histidine kinase n=1 Tax=Virgibacillus alimentarius TaxID=698769 RepID=A0ABS4SC52_9BACI|nr:signal transduction histidine kinase [Virgibacillus alimentarius]
MPEHDVIIISDDSAVTRVIENLIFNAITHSDGNIIISLEEKDSKARLTVRNDTHSLTEKMLIGCLIDFIWQINLD